MRPVFFYQSAVTFHPFVILLFIILSYSYFLLLFCSALLLLFVIMVWLVMYVPLYIFVALIRLEKGVAVQSHQMPTLHNQSSGVVPFVRVKDMPEGLVYMRT